MFNSKAVKGTSQQNNDLFFTETRQQIHPIPVIYAQEHQKQYNSKFNKTFALRGYRHIFKLAAVGERTEENLKKMNKSCLKSAKSVEFDPYLCDASGIKPLIQVLMKLKTTITSINLIIRRTERSNEMNTLSFCLSRIRGLSKLRWELASSLKISQDSLTIMKERLEQCYMLKSVEIQLVYLQNAGQTDYRGFVNSYAKLLKLEEFRHKIFTYHTPKNEYTDVPSEIPNLRRVKRVSIKISPKTGWTSMTDGAGQFLPVYLRSFSERLNPTSYNHIFSNYLVPTEAVEEFAKMISKLLELKRLFVEFSYCKLGDLELMMLAEGFTYCKHVEHLTFKFIERSPIPLENVCQFVQILADLGSFQSFDLFFRRLKYSASERLMIEDAFSKISNLEYVLTKESLHVHKKEPH